MSTAVRTPTARRCASDESARAVRGRMSTDRRSRSTRLGLAIALTNAALYLTTFAALLICESWWLKGVLIVANGLLISTLFIIGHDACHDSLTASSRLNRLIARLAFLPALQPRSTWALTHNGIHHGWTNLKGFDPVFAPLSKAEFDALPAWRQTLERIYRTIPGLGLYYFYELYWKGELFPPRSQRPRNRSEFEFDRGLVLAFFALQLCLAYFAVRQTSPSWSMAAGQAAAIVLIPFAIWNGITGFVTFQHHTHPRVPWFANLEEWSFYRGQVCGTTHVVFPGWINAMLHNIMEHTAHHADPRIPLYRLQASQRALEDAYEHEVVVVRWTPADVLRTTAACKLYDYDRHCWTGFDGVPTGQPTI